MSTAGFVASLVVAIVAVQVVLWFSVRLWFRHRRRTIASRLEAELAGETTIRPPELGSYRGATIVDHPTLNNDGMIALTTRRLAFRTLTGKSIDVPVADFTGVREAKVFKRVTAPGGRAHLVIRTSSGDVAFLVRDNDAWIASLATIDIRLLPDEDEPIPSLVHKRGGSKTVLAVVFTTIGLAFGLAAGITAAVKAQSISGDHYATGTVVELSHEGRGYDPVVEFTPPGHPPVRFTSTLGSNPPAFHVGEPVPVRYDPDDPHDAGIDTYWQTWSTPTLLGAFAVTFLPVGIAFGIITLRARRATQR